MGYKHSFIAIFALTVITFGASQPVDQALVLKDAPEEVLFRVGKDQKPFELNCAVESGDSAKAQFEWHKDDKPLDLKSNPKIEQSQGKLVFKEPKDSDEGIYQCFATTSAGVASTGPVKVKKTYLTASQLSSKQVRPVEGRPFELDCKVPEGYPKPTIEWKKQSVATGKLESFRSPRIFSPQGNLYFSNATNDDVSKEYKYVCLAKSPAVDSEVPISEYIVEGLSKDDKPTDNEVVRQFVSQDFTAKVGDVTEIYCVYGGNPMPHPDWWKDGVNVNNGPGDRVTRRNRSKGKRLLIKETLPEDEGQYTCVIDNEVGKVQNYTLHLTVVSTPKLGQKPAKRINVKVGQEIFVPCEIENLSPKVESTWTFNGKPIANEKYNVNQKGLTIAKAQESDTGYYGCRAVNSIGQAYAETLVQVS